MKSYCFALAACAAMSFAGAAYAGDATAPKAMSDSEMDKVTAGAGFGTNTALEHTQSVRNAFFGVFDTADHHKVGAAPSLGNCTASANCVLPK